jgi:predicted transcriptional regulator
VIQESISGFTLEKNHRHTLDIVSSPDLIKSLSNHNTRGQLVLNKFKDRFHNASLIEEDKVLSTDGINEVIINYNNNNNELFKDLFGHRD